MLTPADLRAMTPEELTALFDEMATAYWGRSDYGVVAAADLDVSRPTIFRWQSSHNVPFPVLYTLDAWLNSDAFTGKLFKDLQDLPEELSAACRHLATAGRTLSQAAIRFPRFIQTQIAASAQDARSCSTEQPSADESQQ